MIQNLYILISSQHLLRSLMNCLQLFILVRIDYLTFLLKKKSSHFDLKDFHLPHQLRPYSYCSYLFFPENYFRIVVEVFYLFKINKLTCGFPNFGFPQFKKFVRGSFFRFGAFIHARGYTAQTYLNRIPTLKKLFYLHQFVMLMSVLTALYFYKEQTISLPIWADAISDHLVLLPYGIVVGPSPIRGLAADCPFILLIFILSYFSLFHLSTVV